MSSENLDEQTFRRGLSVGIEIGRQLGEIEGVIRQIQATAVCNQPVVYMAEALHSFAKKLVKETQSLVFSIKENAP